MQMVCLFKALKSLWIFQAIKNRFPLYKIILISIILSCTLLAHAEERNIEKIADEVIGDKATDKLSFHAPFYFVLGDDDLKLQFSLKYRLLKNLPVYFAYGQLMFWKVYDESKPFEDVNYKPEIFYRLVDQPIRALRSIDLGYLHTSNGQAEENTRSLDRVYVRGSFLTNINERYLGLSLMVFNIYNEDDTNKDIVNYMGYWDLSVRLANVFKIDDQGIDLEIRTFAGSKIFDIDHGGYQTGLIYNFASRNFSPSLYLQRYEGFSEGLLSYNKRRTEYRLGFMLSY
jgi:phospholipase A1